MALLGSCSWVPWVLCFMFADISVVRALNPVRGILFLLMASSMQLASWFLGSVFLCATGAGALYSDMGHVGKGSCILRKLAFC